MEIKSIEIIKQEFNNGNNGIIYDDINLEDKNKYYWKCSDCDEIWQTSNYQRRIVKKGNCLFCTGQKVRKVESLGFLYPELITELKLHFATMQTNPISPAVRVRIKRALKELS